MDDLFKSNKYKYLFSLFLILFLFSIAFVFSYFGSEDLDILCNSNENYLKRTATGWGCYDIANNEAYAEMWAQDIEVSIDAVDTYYNVTNLSLEHAKNVGFSNSSLIIQQSGHYAINSQFAFSDGAINEFHLGLGINGVRELHCHTERKLGTGGDVGSASFTCIDNFTEGDILTVMIENTVSTSNPTIHDINLNINKIGGVS